MRGVPRARRAISLAPSSASVQTDHPRAAPHDAFELRHRVEIQPHRNAEAVAQRRRQQPRAGGRADQRELRQIDLHRARRRPGADDQIELEILHRGIEDFLDRRIEAMDFVDEQDVARLEIGELGGKIARLGDHRPGGRAEIDAEFARDDLRQRRLAKAGRPDEQHVIQRLAARLGRFDEDFEVFAHRLLAGEIGEDLRAQRDIVLDALFGRDQAGAAAHVTAPVPSGRAGSAPRSARRRRARRRPWRPPAPPAGGHSRD